MPDIEQDIQNYLSPDSDEDIDIKSLIKFFTRNKKLLIKFMLISLSISGILLFFTKPKYSGEFQIVLKSKNRGNNTLAQIGSSIENPAIRNYLKIGSQKKDIKTEVQILKSPSVLMPVYLFAKELKKNSSENEKKLTYKSWLKKHVSITLLKGTTVLDINYSDNDKENIFKILNKISKTYQQYSNKDRVTDIQKGIIYIKDQIELYKKKSLNSLKAAQEFSTREDLIPFTVNLPNKSNSGKNITTTNIEEIRVNASNEIRNIDEQIKQIKELSNKEDVIIIGRTFKDFRESNFSQYLDEIDLKIAKHRAHYKSEDKTLKNFEILRQGIINNLYDNTLNYLYAKRINALSREKAFKRPKGVLIKYRELVNQALRDQATLNELEDQERFLSLEQAKTEDPWELITKPTIYNKAISPNKKLFLFLGLLIGATTGLGYSFTKEKREDIIYTKKEIINLLNKPGIPNLEGYENYQLANDNFIKLNKIIKSYSKENIGFIPIGSFNDKTLNEIKDKLKLFNKNSNFYFTNQISEFDKFEKCILIFKLGLTTKNEIQNQKYNLEIFQKNIIAIIYY